MLHPYASPEELKLRNTNGPQNLTLCSVVLNFCTILSNLKKEGPEYKLDYERKRGMDYFKEYLEEAKEGVEILRKINFFSDCRKKLEKKDYISLLAKNPDDLDNVEQVIGDLHNLFKKIEVHQEIKNNNLDHYLDILIAYSDVLEKGSLYHKNRPIL